MFERRRWLDLVVLLFFFVRDHVFAWRPERRILGRTDPTAGGDDGAASSGGGGASGANADKVGAQCVKNADCPSNACLFKKNADYGYCSKTCQSFTECPTFWTCEAVQNGSSKYCTQK